MSLTASTTGADGVFIELRTGFTLASIVVIVDEVCLNLTLRNERQSRTHQAGLKMFAPHALPHTLPLPSCRHLAVRGTTTVSHSPVTLLIVECVSPACATAGSLPV